MAERYKAVKPTIHLNAHRNVDNAQIRSVLLGMEEEGVPFVVNRVDELNPLVLAHDAAVSSPLGVGVGLALDYAVVTTNKLFEHRPYLVTWLGVTTTNDRHIGANAARLVKQAPLIALVAPPAHERTSP